MASAAAAVDAVVDKANSPFLRFGNPVPTDVGMNQFLPLLPETKVRVKVLHLCCDGPIDTRACTDWVWG